jgi:NAD(P)-dependent dehydrogenase (short-subunit alcohol dehydrogenase family)
MPGGLQRLTNKGCVVTGAASPLAQVVADRLAREGATVVGVDNREHRVGAHPRRADLTDEDRVRQLFASIKSDLGRIDVLYSSVGLNDRDDHSALDMPLRDGRGSSPPISRPRSSAANTPLRICWRTTPPNGFETPQLRALFDNMGDDDTARRFVHYPMGRFGTPDELAATVAYLASDDAGFITGAAFPLDGGITSAFTVPS